MATDFTQISLADLTTAQTEHLKLIAKMIRVELERRGEAKKRK